MSAHLGDADERAIIQALTDASCIVPQTHNDHPGIVRALALAKGERPVSEYPECDKLVAVAPLSQRIGDFLDWLEEQGYHLARYGCPHGHVPEPGETEIDCRRCTQTETLWPGHEPYEKLLARFFEIDLNRVDRERRALLKTLQETANANG